jgi:hypothetical protein
MPLASAEAALCQKEGVISADCLGIRRLWHAMALYDAFISYGHEE